MNLTRLNSSNTSQKVTNKKAQPFKSMMLAVVLIFPFLRTLQGSPVPTSTLPDISGVSFHNLSTAASVNSNYRSTSQIALSCILTIFACVWTSGHANIPGPTDGIWTQLKRRAMMMFCTLIAPELTLFWAIRQQAAAKRIAESYNAEILSMTKSARNSNELTSDWLKKILSLGKNVKNSLEDLPFSAAQRRSDIPWTQAHGFFVQMGGFILYDGETPLRVLNYTALSTLILEKRIDRPILTHSDIQDRSKGDGLAKGIVVLQTTWFVVQCLTRLREQLPLTELEVVTLGFAVLNIVIYAVWWSKPQNVGVAVCVYLRRKDEEGSKPAPVPEIEMDEKGPESHSGTATATFSPVNSEEFQDTIPAAQITTSRQSFEDSDSGASSATMNGPSAARGTWLRRLIEAESSHYHWLFFRLVMTPLQCLGFALGPFRKLILENTIPAGSVRVPAFYADGKEEGIGRLCASCFVGTVFGMIHLIPWSSTFPSEIERLMWRISSIVIIILPIIFLILGILDNYPEEAPVIYTLQDIIVVPLILGIPFYIVARLALIGIAFLALRALVPQAHLTVSWTSFIPHL